MTTVSTGRSTRSRWRVRAAVRPATAVMVGAATAAGTRTGGAV
jgi:hypothetical protein